MNSYFHILFLLLFGASLNGQNKEEKPVISIGKFKRIFDQSTGDDDVWYMNDHCFIKGPEG
jgi:hypothetical protein